MKYLLAAAVLFFLASAGVSAMPYVRVLGVTPDLVLVFAACWTMVRGQGEGMIIVPMAGFMRDLTTSDPIGTSVLALAPLVLLAAAVQMRAVDTLFVPTVVVVAVGSAVYGIICMIVLAATGQNVPLMDGLFGVVVPATLVNSLFTAIVYLPLSWLSPTPRAGFLGSRRPLSTL